MAQVSDCSLDAMVILLEFYMNKCGCMQLEAEGMPCTSISGELDKDRRDAVIKEFRTGVTRVLISTDVLARGFDVQQVTLILQLMWTQMISSDKQQMLLYLSGFSMSVYKGL